MPVHPITGEKLVEGVNADRRGGVLRPRMPATAADLAAKQATTENEFLKRYAGAIGGLTPISTIASRLESELGIPQARRLTTGLTQTALDIEGRLSALPRNIESETRGFDVNAAQLAKIKEARTAPVVTQLSETARAAERANINLRSLGEQAGQRLGYEVAEQERGLRPLETEAAMISDRLAREVTMYTVERQNETSLLVAKLAKEGTLEAAEIKRLADLALQEDKYMREKDLAEFKASTGGSGIDWGSEFIEFFGLG